MLCSPQPKIKLHRLILEQEALIDTAQARRVSPGVDVGQDSSLGLTHRHGVQRSAWGNSLHQHQPKCHKAPSADSTLTLLQTFSTCSSTDPKAWGAEHRFVTSPSLFQASDKGAQCSCQLRGKERIKARAELGGRGAQLRNPTQGISSSPSSSS